AGASSLGAFIGPVLGVAYIIWHIIQATSRWNVIRYILLILTIGIIMERGVLMTMVYTPLYPAPISNPWIPLWLVAIWGSFPCVCLNALRSLFKSPPLAILTGAIAGPMAYLGAEQLGAIQLITPITSLVILSGCWAVIMWLISRTLPPLNAPILE
ncbi:MAG: DUF2878 family protein, partial [Candidatus Marinamargulisbacteria bacterium]